MNFDTSTTVTADLKNLPMINEFVRSHAIRAEVSDGVMGKIDLVIEELFVNIVKYSYHNISIEKTVVEIQCKKEKSSDTSAELLVVIFKDFGSPFNPLEQEAPLLDTTLDERKVGGLGIYLVDLMADDCSYTREGECNLFRVCFTL